MKKIVLMHEIGHDRLHRDKADDSGGFAEYDICLLYTSALRQNGKERKMGKALIIGAGGVAGENKMNNIVSQ